MPEGHTPLCYCLRKIHNLIPLPPICMGAQVPSETPSGRENTVHPCPARPMAPLTLRSQLGGLQMGRGWSCRGWTGPLGFGAQVTWLWPGLGRRYRTVVERGAAQQGKTPWGSWNRDPGEERPRPRWSLEAQEESVTSMAQCPVQTCSFRAESS